MSRKQDRQTLDTILLRCPETMEVQEIVRIRSTRRELIITTCGKSTAWEHRIRTSETDPNKIKKAKKPRPALAGQAKKGEG